MSLQMSSVSHPIPRGCHAVPLMKKDLAGPCFGSVPECVCLRRRRAFSLAYSQKQHESAGPMHKVQVYLHICRIDAAKPGDPRSGEAASRSYEELRMDTKGHKKHSASARLFVHSGEGEARGCACWTDAGSGWERRSGSFYCCRCRYVVQSCHTPHPNLLKFLNYTYPGERPSGMDCRERAGYKWPPSCILSLLIHQP